MSASLYTLDPRFRPYAQGLLDVARRFGLEPVVTSTRRTFEEQRELYRKFLSGENPYPVTRPGTSLHEHGLAIDIVTHDNDWLGAVWIHWGGSWSARDRVHYSV